MGHVLVTGMSGAGKTTVLEELARGGYSTVDTDDDRWTTADGSWDEVRMTRLLASEAQVVVSGTVANQVLFYDRFAHVVLLSAPVEVLLERLRTRTNNPYGKTPEQQEDVRRYVREVEPLLRRGATLELDGRRTASLAPGRMARHRHDRGALDGRRRAGPGDRPGSHHSRRTNYDTTFVSESLWWLAYALLPVAAVLLWRGKASYMTYVTTGAALVVPHVVVAAVVFARFQLSGWGSGLEIFYFIHPAGLFALTLLVLTAVGGVDRALRQ